MDQIKLPKDSDPTETAEWLESIQAVLGDQGPARAQFLLGRLIEWGRREGVVLPFTANTPYVNTIPVTEQPPYPGDRAMERRIKSLVRWNAMAMVVRANRRQDGIGGHLSTYQSVATLFEVGFNHFFRAHGEQDGGDQIYFQGHAAPGIYSRAYLERRIGSEKLHNFRRELEKSGGLSSYPHPWLMPDFWEFPTVSMGLSAMSSIYQARFNRYLRDRGLKDTDDSHVWAFLGDGEMDEPESLGAITLASREGLDNLIWVINCNLQRLDGPVRGNGQIVQELEAAFRGAGWNVVKVLWGSEWDPLFEADTDGLLTQRMGETVDGQWQKYTVESGAYAREHFFGADPRLAKLVEHLADSQIYHLKRGGHDPAKVHAAYRAAVDHRGSPTVILAKTVKGYGLGEAGEGRNISHQQKKLNEEELRYFRDRFDIPVTDKLIEDAPFWRPAKDSEEHEYLMERRRALGGFVPARKVRAAPLQAPPLDLFDEFLGGSKERDVATTMAFVRMLSRLMDHEELGRLIVPIVPDEARTFGMDALFRKYGIYAHGGQLYEPVDSHLLLYYREAKDGQLLEEGITEAGSMASFTAAGTAHVTHAVNAIPFFIFYSMFGFQRIGDSIWAHADSRGRGFLVGATAGRTTLAGEGLQHQDGHSHLLASTVPTIQPYDPAFAYEIAVIIQDGIRRMYTEGEDIFYYLTVENEPYPQPPMPEGVNEGILRGLYKFKAADKPGDRPRVHLFGSGALLRSALEAQQILAEQFDVAADVWSATSYTLLRREALAVERWNMLHPAPAGAGPRSPYVTELLASEPWPVIAVSDYLKAVPDQIARWVPGGLYPLGTDGFGRSESRRDLRRHFEVDAAHITLAALHQLAQRGQVEADRVADAIERLDIDADKPNPATA
ncbi:MAG TPA: pyruvate dehydrogenase (acetyl-transferring), homodimeric type [Phycisphaerae bacterium]|nr:pyruvate dehydrogenase (acetyl-transferring), homodimeric type [Phycisphaerae bacterium]